jgi:predicted nuclease with TOPRIM domain
MGETGEFESILSDPRYAEFRQYLEEKQLMTELTKILVQLYETNDKPSDPTAFCRDYFSHLGGYDINALNEENDKLATRLEDLKGRLETLEKELAEFTA